MTIINPKSIAGITSITTASGADNLLTVHTNNTTERVRINNDGDVIVGSGITVSPDGDIFATGVTTATTFVGALTGNVTGNATGLSGTPNISAGTIAGSTGTFTGDVDIADKIVHTGDTDTAIRFSGADTITAETGGTARVSIDSSGRLLLGAGAIATPKSSGAGGLDLDNGSISLVVGGNENSTGRTDGTSKINRIAAPHRTNSEEPVAMLSCQASTSTNTLFYGGGSSYTNAVTEHKFYTAADATTTTGTQRLRIRSNGELQVGVLDTPSASRGAFGIKASNDAQSVGINLYLQEVSGGEGYGIGVDGDGDLNIYNGGATSPTLEILDNNNVEITDGDLVIGTSGHGIDFSATGQGTGTMSNELLDDYEEGTFDPILQGGSNGYRFQYGYYVKVGAAVHFTAFIEVSATPPSSNISIGGLPFTSSSDSNANAYVFPMLTNRTAFGTSGQMNARFYMWTNSTYATLYYPVNSSSSNFTTVNADNMNAANASNVWMSGTYFTAS